MMKKNTLALIVFTAAMSTSNISFAADAKTVAGAICQPRSDEYNIDRNLAGHARNISSSTQFWTCPIVRDSMSPNLRDAQMQIINATGTMSCTFYSRSVTGGFVSSVTRSTGLSGGTVQTLSWPSIADANNGYYYLRCIVPAGSSVISYRWNENT